MNSSATSGRRFLPPLAAPLVWLGLRSDCAAGPTRPTSDYDSRQRSKSVADDWPHPTYFFLSGMAVGGHLLAAVMLLFGRADGRAAVRLSRYLSFAAAALSPISLLQGRGRLQPNRSPNRNVRVNTGRWDLTALGLISGVLAARQVADDGWLPNVPGIRAPLLKLPSHAVQIAGVVPALRTASATGRLLSATGSPLETAAHPYLGPLFLASGLSTAGAAVALLLAHTGASRRTRDRVGQVERVALAAELAISLALLRALGPWRAPLVRGRLGAIYRWGALGTGVVLPLVAHRPGRRHTAAQQVRLSLVGLVGGYLLQYTIVEAGKRSAQCPQATCRGTTDTGDADA